MPESPLDQIQQAILPQKIAGQAKSKNGAFWFVLLGKIPGQSITAGSRKTKSHIFLEGKEFEQGTTRDRSSKIMPNIAKMHMKITSREKKRVKTNKKNRLNKYRKIPWKLQHGRFRHFTS